LNATPLCCDVDRLFDDDIATVFSSMCGIPHAHDEIVQPAILTAADSLGWQLSQLQANLDRRDQVFTAVSASADEDTVSSPDFDAQIIGDTLHVAASANADADTIAPVRQAWADTVDDDTVDLVAPRNTLISAAASAEEDTCGPAIAMNVSLGAGETGGPAEDRKNDLSQLALIYHRTPFAAPRANSLRSANMFHVARIVFFQYVLLPICNTLTSHSP